MTPASAATGVADEPEIGLEDTQRAVLNILEDFGDEKTRLEDTQRAVLNILDDFEEEKTKVDAANEQLTLRSHELARSNEELEMFAYVASHDLQEPLRMITSYTQLLADRYRDALDADATEFIGFVVDGTTRMRRLILDLLAFSRANTSEMAPAPTDLGDVLDDVLSDLERVREETGATITHDTLPVAFADRTLVTQVLQNLVQNAIKFSGDTAPVVHVGGEETAGTCLLSVRDEGVGIEARFTDEIFRPFRRLHGRDVAGTGLGLAICRKLIERQGGRIWVETSPGHGSTFWFTLPSSEREPA